MEERKRWRGKPTFNPTITQNIREALRESGREDLVDGMWADGLEELEKMVADLRKEHGSRITALEQERTNFATQTGVVKKIDEAFATKSQRAWAAVAKWSGSKIVKGLTGLLGLGAAAAIGHLWK